jgi:23S rRNA (uracil1939-C5)-methyltransferase
VFVPRTAPGDIIEAEIIDKRKDYSIARLTGILEPSPDRQESVCIAGCCPWQHIRYERQVDHKQAIIRESFQRLGHLNWDETIRQITGPDRNYRLRATFHVVDGRLGFMQEKTNVVIPIQGCASLVPELNQFIASVDPEGAHEVHVVSAPEIAATFVFEDGTVKRSGRAMIHVDGIRYRISAETFFQANRFLLTPFINEVLSQAGPFPTHVLELYSGSGFFSIPLSRVAKEVIGIDSNRGAVRQARESARLNERWNVKFFERSVDATLRSADLKPDVVVLDPPRAGFGARNAERIASLQSGRIVYVSCNPTTFSPDAAILMSKGYDLRRVTFIDQFPNTYHIEMVALFELK